MINSLFIAFLIGVAGMGVLLWLRWFRDPPSYLNRNKPSPIGLLDVLICFMAVMIVPGLVAMMVMHYFGGGPDKTLSPANENVLLCTVSLVQLVSVVMVIALTVVRYGKLADVFGIESDQMGPQVLVSLKAFAMTVPLLLVVQGVLSLLQPYQHSTLAGLQEQFSLSRVLVSWLGAVVAAPICEEFLFRGFLQSWLQRIDLVTTDAKPMAELGGGWVEDREYGIPIPLEGPTESPLNWWWPICISSALFAAVHIGQGLAPIPLFFFGLVLGFLYRYTGSIVPCIILHFLLNAMSMLKATLDVALASG